MAAAVMPPRMRSSISASRVRGQASVKRHQGEEAKPKREIDDVQHGTWPPVGELEKELGLAT